MPKKDITVSKVVGSPEAILCECWEWSQINKPYTSRCGKDKEKTRDNKIKFSKPVL